MRPNLFLPALLCAAVLAGCNKQQDAGTPTPATAKDPSPAPVQAAKVVKPGQGGALAAPGSQPTSMPAGHPPMGGQQMPPGHPPTGQMPAGHPPTGEMPAGHPPVDGPEGSVAGTITLADALKGELKPGSVLFIIARRDTGDGQRGMLLAAKKVEGVTAESFPLKYTVTQQDVMMQGTALNGTVRISARLDQDGDAISKSPGDIAGEATAAHPVGTEAVDFILDQKL